MADKLKPETTYEPTPATTLNSSSNGVHPLFEVFDAAKVSDKSLLQGTIWELSAVHIGWRKVLPKEGMVDVTSTVELQRRLQRDDLLGSFSLGEGHLRSVQTVHVGLVVLGVVKLHNLLRDVWLEGLRVQPNPTASTSA